MTQQLPPRRQLHSSQRYSAHRPGLTLLACLWLAAPGHAFDLLGTQNSPLANNTSTTQVLAQEEFLPVDEAFRFSYQLQDDQLELRWDLADHYYLYQERFTFSAENNAQPKPFYSPAELKFDELFGRETLVHYGLAKVRINLNQSGAPQEINLSYQGCADAGLCYPPQTRKLRVNTSVSPATIQLVSAQNSPQS